MKLRDTTSHLLLFMIADEKQYSKPHSILNFVRAFSFCSISDDSVSKVCNELRASMISIGLVPVGFVTDGEWNSIRTMWTDRPISVMQLLMDAQKEGTLMHVSEITKCLTIKYACLKSIMAQYIYRYKIDSWALQDVDFINHPYFPEYDERVGEYFHEREDRGHVLKRFTHSFRDGNIPGIDLRRFVEALKDPSTGLTKQERKKVEKESRMYLIVKRCGLKVLWNFFTSMVTMLRKG